MGAPISDSQSAQMGKSGEHGAQEENTHQKLALRQLVVFIRQKAPGSLAGNNLAGAESLMGKVTGAVDKATDAVEGAMASIPGLNMLIKEEKDKSDDSEKAEKNKYKYFEDYASWDKLKKNYDAELPEMDPESGTMEFEYESKTADERKQDAAQLAAKIISKLSEGKGYSRCVHLVGLAQGGNIASECTALLQQDSGFSGDDKCWVASVITIATPQYKTLHQVEEKSFKGKGKVLRFGNRNDFTQQAIAFFHPQDKLIEKIKEANSGTLSVFTGKIKLHMIQALACIMKGVGTGSQTPEQLYNGVKGEIEAIITGVTDILKKLVGEGIGLFQPGDVSHLKNVMNGYDQIPSQSAGLLKSFFSDLPSAIADEGKKAFKGGDSKADFGPQMLMGMFNCFCPLVDAVSNSLAVFKYDTPASEEFAQQIIEGAGIEEVYTPAPNTAKDLGLEQAVSPQPEEGAAPLIDMAPGMMNKVRQLLTKGTENKENKACSKVSELTGPQKQAVAEAIFVMATPMLATKRDFYAKLLDIIPFSLDEYIMKADSDKAAGKITGLLSKLNLKLPDKLQASLSRNKSEMTRVAGFFKKNNYPVSKGADTLKYVYESHNLALQKCYGDVALAIDQQTKMLDHMKAKGYKNTVTADENKYELETSGEKSGVMAAPEVRT